MTFKPRNHVAGSKIFGRIHGLEPALAEWVIGAFIMRYINKHRKANYISYHARVAFHWCVGEVDGRAKYTC